MYQTELATFKRDTRRFRNWKIARFIRSSKVIMAAAYIVAVIRIVFKGRQATAFAAFALPVLVTATYA